MQTFEKELHPRHPVRAITLRPRVCKLVLLLLFPFCSNRRRSYGRMRFVGFRQWPPGHIASRSRPFSHDKVARKRSRRGNIEEDECDQEGGG